MSNSASSEESYHDLPFDFHIRDDDLDQSALVHTENGDDSYDDGFNWGQASAPPESFVDSPNRESMTSELMQHEHDSENDLFSSSMNEEPSADLLDLSVGNSCDFPIEAQPVISVDASCAQEPMSTTASTEQQISDSTSASSTEQTFIPHKGALKQIIVNPNSNDSSSNKDPSAWPVYSITVDISPESNTLMDSTSNNQYQVLFSRTQYEQCVKLFTLLDTECKSSLGAKCIKEFVWRYCPVVKKRDDALLAIAAKSGDTTTPGDTTKQHTELHSSTLDEIWNVVIESDPSYQKQCSPRLGLESFMLFFRLLSLTSHLESQRRFASRHLQQMMRHKHSSSSGASPRGNSEVVVVIDNPPAGPPLPISFRGLMEVEFELGKEDKSGILVKDWLYASLPMVELDLDHAVVKNDMSWGEGKIVIEPFSTSDGDFILRYGNSQADKGSSSVVRRSYTDFYWLNETLIRQKRPGHGNLCGRILPPFPPRYRSSSGSGVQYQAPRSKDVSERAVAAAKSGVGIITSVAKSLWGNYIAPTASLAKSPSASPTVKRREVKAQYSWPGLPHREQNASAQLARRMNRYLNYLLENQALCTSFPLNAILTASQSGLECSKQILSDHAKQKKRRRTTQHLMSGSSSSAYAILTTLIAKKPSSYFNLSDGDDTPWLRIAARAAMSLQFHGILETTGHESTSAKIQHASLPKFGGTASSWDEDEPDNAKKDTEKPILCQTESSEGDFESGVIRIESELAGEDDIEGYDLLPSPGPSEQHHVLNATYSAHSVSEKGNQSASRIRFVYGSSSADGSSEVLFENHSADDAAALGSVKVDHDIDKLKGIIKSMDHILKRLYKSSMIIESSQSTRNALKLDLLKDIDSFGDSRGGFISQRSLVDGVAALGSANAKLNSSNGNISDDLGWQSALASSAVGATKEVKEAVVSSRTASTAKAAAFTAAAKSKKVYESLGASSSRDEISAAQSEASATQSHAIHATVVEYEANTAKKRAAVSLAQDVKCWNAYRKRELLQTCIDHAKSQREACKNAADAWESLKRGLIDSSSPLFAHGELDVLAVHSQNAAYNVSRISAGMECSFPVESNKSVADADDAGNSSPTLKAEITTPAAKLPEAFVDVTELTASAFGFDDSSDNVYLIRPPDMSNLNDDHFALQQATILSAESSSQSDEEAIDICAFQVDDLNMENVLDQREDDEESHKLNISNENMTMSMQSLIDGLMAWGGEDEPINDIGHQTEVMGQRLKTSALLE